MHATMMISNEESMSQRAVEAPAAGGGADEAGFDHEEEEDYGHFEVADDDDAEEQEDDNKSSIASKWSNGSTESGISRDGSGGGGAKEDDEDANAHGCSPSRAPSAARPLGLSTPLSTTTTRNDHHLLSLRDRTESSSNLLLMRRVGSTFFSVSGSVASDLDVLEWTMAPQYHRSGSGDTADVGASFDTARASASRTPSSASLHDDGRAARMAAAVAAARVKEIAQVKWNVADVLYHDVMMNVFSFMPAEDLASYSTTGKRPNIDVFAFVLLQLERALILTPAAPAPAAGPCSEGSERRSSSVTPAVDVATTASSSTTADDSSESRTIMSTSSTCPIDICGAGILSRLAVIDRIQAEDLVERYRTGCDGLLLSSSSSPMAFRADAALRELQNHMGGAASCAVVFTMLGAANKFMDGGLMHAVPHNALLGCAGLGLVATRYAATTGGTAAGHSSIAEEGGDGEDGTANGEGGASARLARRMQALLMTLPRVEEGEEGSDAVGGAGSVFPLQIVERLAGQFHHNVDNPGTTSSSSSGRRGKRTKRKGSGGTEESIRTEVEKECSEPSSEQKEEEATTKRRPPSGHIGSYVRLLQLATEAVTRHVRFERQTSFERLSDDEKTLTTTALIDACSSDANLELVKDLVREKGVDVNGFYVGSDGTTETCALHTASFNNATKVMRFLCSGIDERHSSMDGGLCDVDLIDENGWTALHFAAGADSAEGVRLLASFGAQTDREAQNGYTPWGWADRLSNTEAAEELRQLGADHRFVFSTPTQPFAFLANRFFSLMPSATPIATM